MREVTGSNPLLPYKYGRRTGAFEISGISVIFTLPYLLTDSYSPASTILVTPDNLAAWVSLLVDMQVRSPAAVLASCPAFLMVPLTHTDTTTTHNIGMYDINTNTNAATGGGAGAGDEVKDNGENDNGSGTRGSETGFVYGGPEYGTAVRRFVGHLRDTLLMDEQDVFGLLARSPPLALIPPNQIDDVIIYLALVIKGAGRGHRYVEGETEGEGGGRGGGGRRAAAAGSLPYGPPYQSVQLPEEVELDLALYRFLRRAPSILAMTRGQLSYVLEQLSYHGGLGYVDMCRLLCAVPELLPAVAAAAAAEAAVHASTAMSTVPLAVSQDAEFNTTCGSVPGQTVAAVGDGAHSGVSPFTFLDTPDHVWMFKVSILDFQRSAVQCTAVRYGLTALPWGIPSGSGARCNTYYDYYYYYCYYYYYYYYYYVKPPDLHKQWTRFLVINDCNRHPSSSLLYRTGWSIVVIINELAIVSAIMIIIIIIITIIITIIISIYQHEILSSHVARIPSTFLTNK
ncbi:hypothetical protein VOLCADRAFT_91583 [Volvox carteri f. nagariensis]|uniref:Uncharacterized protein n=1 Tax=Volvox carteri f. nagariensis TaxID=3068 RepID=D8TXG4_VOLCA|nr:uncharacterized protein VOLCADRAFT_91583 [Volvox carteri f. nagariensis]EFJ48003.1 hypothetical protein VOLCADRAFT_91583 [Volvox carteri f. nagariensis]|eukprot:XP_002951109.1 hypothetical protein VOLCADRAFT_91583 [Volvox carteri f. nagariensis]